MSRKYKFRNPDALYFVSFAVVRWIDLFIRPEYKYELVQSWRYCQINKGLKIHAWCIMTSHVHMIISSNNELSGLMRDMKSYTSRKIRAAIIEHPGESRREWMMDLMIKAGLENRNNNDFQLWQHDNHPIELTSNFMIDQKLNYLHNNPVVAGFVYSAEQYPYSSAKNYFGVPGILELELLD